jgi:hypothetical protein
MWNHTLLLAEKFCEKHYCNKEYIYIHICIYIYICVYMYIYIDANIPIYMYIEYVFLDIDMISFPTPVKASRF